MTERGENDKVKVMKEKSIKIRERGNILIILTLVFIGVVLVLGGVYIYFRKSPEKVVNTMMTKMQDVKSFHCQIDIEISGKADLPIPSEFQQTQGIKANISLEGDVDLQDINNPQISFLFSFHTGQGPIPLDLEGELRMINRIIYLQLSKLPTILKTLNLNQLLENQWVKIDVGAGKDQFLDKSEEFQGPAKGKDIYTVEEVFEDEVINNVKTYHYRIALNKAELKDLIIEMYKIVLDRGFQELNEEQLKQIDQAIEDQANAIKNIELWIGQEDHFLYKIATSYNLVDEDKRLGMAFVFSITFSNLNEPVSVTEPENVKSFKEILESLSKSLKSLF